MSNGNGKLRHSLSIVQWNAGNKHWHRKVEELEAFVLEKNPDLFFVTEANLMSDTPEYQTRIAGYYMVLPPTMQRLKYCRIVLLVRDGIQVKILEEHMDTDLASIWVKIGQQGRKPIVVGGVYREQHLLQPGAPRGTPNTTGTPMLQRERWGRVLQGWKAATRNEVSIVTGDMNLDYGKWHDPDYRLVKMVDRVKAEIEPLGFYQMVNTHTRSWAHQSDSTVDHCWSNSPNRVISYTNNLCTYSDHNVITVLIRFKDRVLPSQEIQKRSRKNLDSKILIDDIKATDWTDLLESNNVDVINGMLEEVIRGALDKQAPVKNIQVRNNYKSWVTPQLKEDMKRRDSLREMARVSGDPQDWSNYRQIRNAITKDLRKAKDDHFKNIFDKLSVADDSKNVYGTAKELLGWKQNQAPTSFLINGSLIRKPEELANAQMHHFEKKIEDLRNKQWPKEKDPLILLRGALKNWKKSDQIVPLRVQENKSAGD